LTRSYGTGQSQLTRPKIEALPNGPVAVLIRTTSTNKKGPPDGEPFLLVEAGGIEPPSESPTQTVLHA